MQKLIIGLCLDPLSVKVYDLKTGEVCFEEIDGTIKSDTYFNAVGFVDFTADDKLEYKTRNQNYAKFHFAMLDGKINELPVFKSDGSLIINKKLVIVAEYEGKGYLVIDVLGKTFGVTYEDLQNWVKQYDFYNYNIVAVCQHEWNLYPVLADPARFEVVKEPSEEIMTVANRAATLGLATLDKLALALIPCLQKHTEFIKRFNVIYDKVTNSFAIKSIADTPNYCHMLKDKQYSMDRVFFNRVLPVRSIYVFDKFTLNCVDDELSLLLHIPEGVQYVKGMSFKNIFSMSVTAQLNKMGIFSDEATYPACFTLYLPSTLLMYNMRFKNNYVPCRDLFLPSNSPVSLDMTNSGEIVKEKRGGIFGYLDCTDNTELQIYKEALQERCC